MCINRFTKIVFSIALVITTQPFFSMEPTPATCAAEPVTTATDDTNLKIFAPALANAIKAGDLPKVQQLLENPTDQKAPQVALILATYYNKFDIIKYLIEDVHVDVDTQNTFSDYYDIEDSIFKTLCKGKLTPLSIAAQIDAVDIAKYLLKKGARVNFHDNYGNTALLHAKSLAITELLVKAGADVHAANKYGWTVLHTPKHVEIERIKYLIAAGADIFARDYIENTAKRVRDSIIDRTPGIDAYLQEVENKELDKKAILYALLACKALVAQDSVPRHGEFPPEDIGRILEPCVKSEKSDRCYTHLMSRVHCGCLSRGSVENEISLHKILEHPHEYPNNPLHTLKYINARDEYQCTALMYACSPEIADEQENLEGIKYLIEQGADISARNMWGETALDIAQRKRHTAIAQYLQQVEKEAVTAKK